jgi:hypothetical protein
MHPQYRICEGIAEMSDSSAHKPSRLWQLIFTGLIVIILVGIANAFTALAYASHPAGWDPYTSAYWRQNNMHSRDASETICIISSSRDQHISAGQFRRTLTDKLYRYNNAGQLNPPNWDELADGKISFLLAYGTGTPDNPQQCHEMTQKQRDAIPIEAYLAHRVDVDNPEFPRSPCSSFAGNSACASNTYRVWNSTVNNWVTAWSYVWFPEAALYRSTHTEILAPQWVISHEFGHVLGLADGLEGTDCTSIMHSGKHKNCPITADTLWPNENDRASVTKIANNGQPSPGHITATYRQFLPDIQRQ